MRLMKHNPAFLAPDELIASFVVRGADLATTLRIIRENQGKVNQHVLLLGARGMGKSTLVRRVALAVEQDPELRTRWLPVLMAEEKYDVATAGEVWLEALGHVSRGSVQDAPRWRGAYERLRRERDPERLREGALARLVELADLEKRRLLIAIENVNLIFAEQAEKDVGWDLRQTLLGEPRIMLLATATARFDQIERADRPMFELFREIRLVPLNTDECRALWKSVAGEELPGDQIRPMEILTGGNPRLLAILASFAKGRSFHELMDKLVVLIDDHTAYFKANVESLPARERRAFVTLAELWAPSGASEVAGLARMEVNETSEYLRRLEARGAVERVGKEGRKVFYQVAERLYNVYHLLRQSSTQADRVHAVVDFMVRFYRPGETVRIISDEAQMLPAEATEAHQEALRYISGRYASMDAGWAWESGFVALGAAAGQASDVTRGGDNTTPAESPIMCRGGSDSSLESMREQLANVEKSYERGDFKKVLSIVDEMVGASGPRTDGPRTELIAKALNRKGGALAELGRLDEAIQAHDESLKFCEPAGTESRMERVAAALLRRGLCLGWQGKDEEAIVEWDQILRRFGDREEPRVAQRVAMGLVNKAIGLANLGHSDEAIAVVDQALQRYGQRQAPEVASQIANLLRTKGIVLAKLGRSEEAITAFDEVLQRLGARQEAEVAEEVARTLMSKSSMIFDLGRLEEAIAVYDDIVRRYGQCKTPESAKFVASALIDRGVAKGRLGHFLGEIQGYDEVVRRFGERQEYVLICKVAFALANKAFMLQVVRRSASKKALRVCDELMARYGHREGTAMAEIVSRCLVTKSLALAKADRVEDATQAVREALSHAAGVPRLDDWDVQHLQRCLTELAAAGQARPVLDALRASRHASRMEPLLAALALTCGEEPRVPREIIEVAWDIVKEIESLGRRRNMTKPAPLPT
ncbi:MAG: tetratricopeptide repeat protein [Planctomycetes bacterium]|nr:tetratricopeptide repeat protein [Planctomycetota bacterium]